MFVGRTVESERDLSIHLGANMAGICARCVVLSKAEETTVYKRDLGETATRVEQKVTRTD